MALTYNNAVRNLAIKGVITLASNDPSDVTQINITSDDVISYTGNSTIGAEGLPLGAAEAASYSLVIDNLHRDENGEPTGKKKYAPEIFDNAEVHMFVGIEKDGKVTYSDFGVWYVNDSIAPEQGVSITLNGYDSLASRFEATFTDTPYDYPMSVGEMAQRACVPPITLKTQNFTNSTIKIDKMPAWEENTTLRHVLSYCAILAGGFVRMSRSGQVEIVSYSDSNSYDLDPGLYQQFSSTGGSKFSFNAIEAMLSPDSDEYARFAVDSDIADNATNTIQLDYNPLVTDARILAVVDVLGDAGLVFEAGSVTWGGDPVVVCGDRYVVTDMNGKEHHILVTQQSFQFDGGLNFIDTCELPSVSTVNSPTFSSSTNMYDANGNIRVTHISGLDQKVINATAGHIGALTADTVEADDLFSTIIRAVNLLVGKIDADALQAKSITADKLAAESITAEKIKAGALDAITVGAVTAKVESLTASDITTDRLAAALAAFTVITAGTAEFDRATVQHLVAQALNLEFGTAGEVFINNLRVAYAQMVQATIGNLCIKASDGKYYRIDVTSGGNVTAMPVSVSEGEINAGQTDDGRVIVETNITAESLNTSNLLATHALINRIDAARIDVDELFAREAFIGKLNTTDISSNSYIQQSIVDKVTGSIEQFARLDNGGLHVGEKGKPGEVLIDSDSVDVRVGGKVFSSFGDDYVEFGNQQMRRTSDGGIAFVTKEM